MKNELEKGTKIKIEGNDNALKQQEGKPWSRDYITNPLDDFFWDDYEEAQWQQELQAQENQWYEQEELEYEEKDERTCKSSQIIETRSTLWDCSGDDSSLNPNFW